MPGFNSEYGPGGYGKLVSTTAFVSIQSSEGLPQMKAALVLLCFVVTFRSIGQVPQAPAGRLENDDIWLLADGTSGSDGDGGARRGLHVELNAVGDHLMSAMVRNDCPKK